MGSAGGGGVGSGGAGGLEVYGICNRSLAYREVVEARADYEKSYFW